jgi:hypothetical protein
MGGYAGSNHGKITNQFTAGGNAKAGLGQNIGLRWFARIAVVKRAPTTIPTPANYPVPNTNVLAGGVSGGAGRFGMFSPSADGVNTNVHAAQLWRVQQGPPGWGLKFT